MAEERVQNNARLANVKQGLVPLGSTLKRLSPQDMVAQCERELHTLARLLAARGFVVRSASRMFVYVASEAGECQGEGEG